MAASITFYNNWKAAINDAALRAATVKVTLHSSAYTFAATQSVFMVLLLCLVLYVSVFDSRRIWDDVTRPTVVEPEPAGK